MHVRVYACAFGGRIVESLLVAGWVLIRKHVQCNGRDRAVLMEASEGGGGIIN